MSSTMTAGVSRKISAASARSHTRRAKHSAGPTLPSGIFPTVLVVILIGVLAWGYQAIQPPPPKICGSTGGPLVTAPRIKLRDGRHLAYQERGVSKDSAKIKVIFIHGLHSCRLNDVIANYTSPELVEELGIYFVSYDRPGYGESDPDPSRSVKSQALDVEELADQLGLGAKFYLIGYSLGGQLTWGCLKYIPHRLAGVSILTPATNYWWTGFPSNLSGAALKKQAPCDYWSLSVAHYAPWLTYWWNTQKWFPVFGVISRSPHILSRQDMEIAVKLAAQGVDNIVVYQKVHTLQQGEYESIHRDLNIGFGTWEFDPMDLENPFWGSEVQVHMWQGDEDYLVPAMLQRYVASRLSWVKYHEVPGSGHFFPFLDGMADTIVKTMLGAGKH
ncbi:hypothetical protein LINPERPRIM_LOCUS16290 [Linum perenne]